MKKKKPYDWLNCLGRFMLGATLGMSAAGFAAYDQGTWQTTYNNTVVSKSGDYALQWTARNNVEGTRDVFQTITTHLTLPAGQDNLGVLGANAVFVDAAGNVYSTGYVDRGDTGQTNGRDVLTAKHDAAGNRIWSTTYNGAQSGYDEGMALAVDAAGNVYVAGRTEGTDTSLDLLLIKYNADGSFAWARTYQTGITDVERDVAVATDGANVYVTGRSHNGSNLDIVTLRYDAAGNGEAARLYDGGSGDDSPVGLGLGPAGEVYVGGVSKGPANNDYVLLKYAPGSLTAVWQVRNDSGSRDEATAMAVDAATNLVYLTGWSRAGGGARNFRTLAFNGSDGSVAWGAATSYTEENHIPLAIAVNAGVVAVAGKSGTQDAYDVLTVSYDAASGTPASGTPGWPQVYDDNNANEIPVAVAVDGTGRVYVTGQRGVTADPGHDIFLIAYDASGVFLPDREAAYDAGGHEFVRDIALHTDGEGLVGIHLAGGSTRDNTAGGSVDGDYTILKYNVMRADLVVDSVAAPGTVASESMVAVTPTLRNIKDSATRKLADAGAFTVEVSLANGTDPNTATLFSLGTYTISSLPSGQSNTTSVSVAIPPVSVIPEGSYWWAVRVDSADAIDEADEGNNLVFGPPVTVIDPPDLVPASIAIVNPATGSAPAASDITVEYSIDNIRSVSTSGAFQVNFVFSSDNVIGNGDDVLLGSDTVTAIIAGNSSFPPTQAVVTIPNTTPPGPYSLGIVVDANDDVLEARDDNNTLATSATFSVEAIPDLQMTAVSGPLGGVAGSPVGIDYTVVANDVGASNITVQFYLSMDTAITDADIFLGTETGLNLTADVPFSGTATLTVPSGVAQGVYYLGAIVNQNNANQSDAIAESDTTNNALAAAQSISIGLPASDPAALPDLVVTDVSGPASAVRGDTISVTTSVSNVLPKDAASSFTVGIYLSPDATITTGDILLGTRVITALAGNTTDTATTSVTIPFEQPEDVVWTDAVGVEVTGNSLRKTAFTDWGNAGAFSVQSLSGDGYVEFTAVEANTSRAIGFSTSNSDNDYATIQFAIIVDKIPNACVSETAFTRTCISYSAGDVFRIERSGTTIRYQRYNSGTASFDTFYTSNLSSTGTVFVDAALRETNATLVNVKLGRNITPGSYYLGAVADTENVVTEVDENNNDAVQTDANGSPATTPIGVATGQPGGGGGGTLSWTGLLALWLLAMRRKLRSVCSRPPGAAPA